MFKIYWLSWCWRWTWSPCLMIAMLFMMSLIEYFFGVWIPIQFHVSLIKICNCKLIDTRWLLPGCLAKPWDVWGRKVSLTPDITATTTFSMKKISSLFKCWLSIVFTGLNNLFPYLQTRYLTPVKLIYFKPSLNCPTRMVRACSNFWSMSCVGCFLVFLFAFLLLVF